MILYGHWIDLGIAYLVAFIVIAGLITLTNYLDRKR